MRCPSLSCQLRNSHSKCGITLDLSISFTLASLRFGTSFKLFDYFDAIDATHFFLRLMMKSEEVICLTPVRSTSYCGKKIPFVHGFDSYITVRPLFAKPQLVPSLRNFISYNLSCKSTVGVFTKTILQDTAGKN